MTRLIVLFCSLSLWLCAPLLSGSVIHVTPTAGNGGSGAVADPVNLEEAIARARLDTAVQTIQLAAGVYTLDQTLDLRALVREADSALTIRGSSAGGRAILRGGRSLSGHWKTPIVNDSVVARMPPAAREAVRVASLGEAGISDFGTLQQKGFNNRRTAAGELFIRGRRQPLAGYPNAGEGAAGFAAGFFEYATMSGGDVVLPNQVATRWGSLVGRDVWAHGYWGTDWADAHLPVTSVADGKLKLGAKPSTGLSGKGAIRIYNLPEELDTPGEWYLDRSSGRLYFWPPDAASLTHATFSTLGGPLVLLEHSRNIAFKDVSFEVSRGDLVDVRKSAEILFRRCQFRGSGLRGLILDGERSHVDDCLFEGMGEGAIQLLGGTREELRPGAHLVSNSILRQFGEVYLTYAPAILLRGVGHTVAHNHLSDAPHEAIQIQGALHRIWRNEITAVCQFTDDAGAIYSGRDWLAWGNRIEENHVHSIHSSRTGPNWVHGVYLDDFASGFTVRGNIFENIAAYAVNVGGGRYNRIEENLFLNTSGGHLNDNRGAKWIVTTPGNSWNMFEGISKVDRQAEPWKSTFPGLAKVPTTPEGSMSFVYPDGTTFAGNAAIGVKTFLKESDWTGGKSGVFSHYAVLERSARTATLPGSLPLATAAGEIVIQLTNRSVVLPLSLMGLRDSFWTQSGASGSAVAAGFSWNTGGIFQDSGGVLDGSASWARPSDPIASYTWKANGTVVGTGSRLHWIPASAGLHQVELSVATTSGARDARSFRLMVEPASARAVPWLGKPRAVPGIVEAEHFDEGRYSDFDSANQGGKLRATPVDIGEAKGDYFVGWTQPGEWLEYTVSASPAIYDVYVRAASRTDGAGIALHWNGELVGARLLPNVGNNRSFARHRIGQISVATKGNHILRATMLGKDFNVDYFEFVEVARLEDQKPQLPEPPVAEQPVPEEPSEEATWRELIEQALVAYRQAHGLAADRTTFRKMEIPLNIHLVDAGQTDPLISKEVLITEVAALNALFAPQNTYFFVNAARRVSHASWSRHRQGSAIEAEMKEALAVHPGESLNIYICAAPRNSDGQPVNYAASAPWEFSETDKMNGIVLAASEISADSLAHAIGRYLGLLDGPTGTPLTFSSLQRARAVDLTGLYRPKLAERSYLWAHAEWSGTDGWRYSDWLKGWVDTSEGNWVYHLEHGWLYTDAAVTHNAWFYTWDLGWLFINNSYPWIYHEAERDWWYYLLKTGSSRWFYRDRSKSNWELK